MTKLNLDSLKLTNFQSHKDTFIEFSDGLNCIIGTSDIGKSALVRALKWVLFNKVPKDFITWGETKCSVLVKLSNGYSVERLRDGKQNTYKLYSKDVEIEVFENFGLEVPLKIKEVVGSLDLVLDTDKTINLNVRSQHDSLFLLSSDYPGSLKAKAMNSLAGIHYIDAALRDITADTKQSKSSVEKGQIEVDNLKLELDTFKDIPALEAKLDKVIKLRDSINVCTNKLEKITNLELSVKCFEERYKIFLTNKNKYARVSVETIKQFNLYVDKYTKICNLSDTVKGFEVRHNNWKIRQAKYNVITINNITQYVTALDKAKKLNELSNLMGMYTFRVAKWKETNKVLLRYDLAKVSNFIELVAKYKACNALHNMLGEFNNKVVLWNASMTHYAVSTKEAKQPYLKAVEHLGVCPICYSALDAEKLKLIEEKL